METLLSKASHGCLVATVPQVVDVNNKYRAYAGYAVHEEYKDCT